MFENLRLVKTLEMGKNGGESVYFHDLDGDGQIEILVRQSPGMLDSPYYADGFHGKITPENADLFMLTCFKQDGRILWQYGAPWENERPYGTHSGSHMTKILDLNGDGKPEVVSIRKDRLLVMEGATGKVIREQQLPEIVFNMMWVQKLKNGKANLIFKCDGTSPYGYGKPIVAFDSELNFLWRHDDLIGGGHNMVLMDVDGDGNDEIFEGYNLIDDDGKVLWSFDFPSHSDQTTVCDINGDGVEEVIYCTDNEDFIIANVKGEHILTVEDFPHPQKVSIGKFMRDVPGKQLFMNNRATHGGAVMLDADGKILWDLPLNGYAQTLSGAGEDGLDLILFSPAPGRCPEALQEKLKVRAAELGYENLPISGNAGFEKLVIDGYGRILAKLPKVCDSIDVTKWGIPQHLKVDYGAGNELNILDLDGDGKLEYVFSDRWNLYIVK